jgi:hypothetical protein
MTNGSSPPLSIIFYTISCQLKGVIMSLIHSLYTIIDSLYTIIDSLYTIIDSIRSETDKYKTLYHSNSRCQCSDDDACAHIRRAETAEAEIVNLKQWIDDLQSGMYINCVYCGHRYGPNDEVPTTMADALKEHIEQCPKHPMSKLKSERDQLKKELQTYKEMQIENRKSGVIPMEDKL